jgi:hypothetical protein
MDRPFAVSAVLFRLDSPKGDVDRVRTLVLGRADDLTEIFRAACQSLFKIRSLTDDHEFAYCLRVEREGALIALATLTHDPLSAEEIPYRVEWLREPSQVDILQWQKMTQDLLDRSIGLLNYTADADARASMKLRIRLLHNRVDTRHYAMPTSMVYPALYAVEKEFGLQYAKGQHLLEALGL